MADPETILGTMMQLSGLPTTGPFRELLHQAVINSWSQDELLFHVVQSPAFESMFPGIMRADGSLKMSPGEYRSTADQFRHTAYVLGYHASTDMIGQWISGDVSPQEVTDRLTAWNRVQENPHAFANLQNEWKRSGLGNITQAGAANALLGAAPKEFYDVWERAQLETSAQTQGIGISHAEAMRIQRTSAEPLTEATSADQMAKLAQDLKTTMPLSRLYASHGLTRSDLITLEFGGPNRADIAIKAQKALNTAQQQNQQQQVVQGPAVAGAARTPAPQTA